MAVPLRGRAASPPPHLPRRLDRALLQDVPQEPVTGGCPQAHYERRSPFPSRAEVPLRGRAASPPPRRPRQGGRVPRGGCPPGVSPGRREGEGRRPIPCGRSPARRRRGAGPARRAPHRQQRRRLDRAGLQDVPVPGRGGCPPGPARVDVPRTPSGVEVPIPVTGRGPASRSRSLAATASPPAARPRGASGCPRSRSWGMSPGPARVDVPIPVTEDVPIRASRTCQGMGSRFLEVPCLVSDNVSYAIQSATGATP